MLGPPAMSHSLEFARMPTAITMLLFSSAAPWVWELDPFPCLVAILFALGAAWAAAAHSKTGLPTVSKIVCGTALLMATLAFVLLIAFSPERDLGTSVRAGESVQRIIRLNADYQRQHGTFAHNLEELTWAHWIWRYEIVYTPDTEIGGTVKHFVVRANPRTRIGIYFYADESGEIRYKPKVPADKNSEIWAWPSTRT
jgi:hypothetical protein